MNGFLLNNNLVPIGFAAISTCSPADVRGRGRLRDKPKEHRRLPNGRLSAHFDWAVGIIVDSRSPCAILRTSVRTNHDRECC